MSAKRTNTTLYKDQREKAYGLRSHRCDRQTLAGHSCKNKVSYDSDRCAAGHLNKIQRSASACEREGWTEPVDSHTARNSATRKLESLSTENLVGSPVGGKRVKVSGESTFEYGIGHRHIKTPHRTGMTERQARTWLAEWLRDGGKPDVFYVIRR